jgi:hypothetical protein
LHFLPADTVRVGELHHLQIACNAPSANHSPTQHRTRPKEVSLADPTLRDTCLVKRWFESCSNFRSWMRKLTHHTSTKHKLTHHTSTKHKQTRRESTNDKLTQHPSAESCSHIAGAWMAAVTSCVLSSGYYDRPAEVTPATVETYLASIENARASVAHPTSKYTLTQQNHLHACCENYSMAVCMHAVKLAGSTSAH